MEDDFDTWGELKRVNQLFETYANTNLYKKFILTEILSIRKCHSSTFIFSSKKTWNFLLKKMIRRFF